MGRKARPRDPGPEDPCATEIGFTLFKLKGSLVFLPSLNQIRRPLLSNSKLPHLPYQPRLQLKPEVSSQEQCLDCVDIPQSVFLGNQSLILYHLTHIW